MRTSCPPHPCPHRQLQPRRAAQPLGGAAVVGGGREWPAHCVDGPSRQRIRQLQARGKLAHLGVVEWVGYAAGVVNEAPCSWTAMQLWRLMCSVTGTTQPDTCTPVSLPACSWSGGWLATAPRWGCSSTQVGGLGRRELPKQGGGCSAAQGFIGSCRRCALPTTFALCEGKVCATQHTCMLMCRPLCPAASPAALLAAGLQSEASRVEELRKFIEYATSQPDVWFVTTQQVGRRAACAAESRQRVLSTLPPMPHANTQRAMHACYCHALTSAGSLLPCAAAGLDGEPSARQPCGAAAQVREAAGHQGGQRVRDICGVSAEACWCRLGAADVNPGARRYGAGAGDAAVERHGP